MGILKCYNLHYNIALIDIKGYWGARAIKISGHQVTSCMKAGIGGPLIDTNGEFVEMNFYHEEETPFLPRDVIQCLLLNLNKERTSADVEGDENRSLFPGGTPRTTAIAEGGENKWPLPESRRICMMDTLPPDALF